MQYSKAFCKENALFYKKKFEVYKSHTVFVTSMLHFTAFFTNFAPIMEQRISDFLNAINEPLGGVMVAILSITGIWFTFRLRGVQFRMFGEMLRLLFNSGDANSRKENGETQKRVSSFEAFTVSLASRVGTGNLAGVATAIVVGGPGAVFWMWVMALIGSVNTFVECTLAQLFKSRGEDSFVGGPAYYIMKGLHSRWFACVFAIATVGQFGLTNNMVQANTISSAFTQAFGFSPNTMAIALTILTIIVIFGGIQRIAKVCSVIVPVMALSYLAIAVWVVVTNITMIPAVLALIVKSAFGLDQAVGGTLGMAITMGFKRGIFSNEAGEGSAPNAAATANVSHPVKQGLIQTLGVFTDTLIVCSCTAFIILCSGLYNSGANGIELTQIALSAHIGEVGKTIIAIAILFFAFSSVIGNYYYGESNVNFLCNGKSYTKIAIQVYRVVLAIIVFLGSLMTIDIAWALVDFFMVIMTSCNLIAITFLGKYVVILLNDYKQQRLAGKNPEYKAETCPEIADETECW